MVKPDDTSYVDYLRERLQAADPRIAMVTMPATLALPPVVVTWCRMYEQFDERLSAEVMAALGGAENILYVDDAFEYDDPLIWGDGQEELPIFREMRRTFRLRQWPPMVK